MSKSVFLVGPPGSGKTAVGQILAGKLDLPFVDSDSMVEETAGRSIIDIFASEGEAAFRSIESGVIQTSATGDASVFACGGGAVLDPSNVAAIQQAGTVFNLVVSPRVAASRLEDERETRPMLAGADWVTDLAELIHTRRDAYRGAARFEIPAEDSVEEVATRIAETLSEFTG